MQLKTSHRCIKWLQNENSFNNRTNVNTSVIGKKNSISYDYSWIHILGHGDHDARVDHAMEVWILDFSEIMYP